jgi:hypothetical protein
MRASDVSGDERKHKDWKDLWKTKEENLAIPDDGQKTYISLTVFIFKLEQTFHSNSCKKTHFDFCYRCLQRL